MVVFTYSEARQKLAALLDLSSRDGQVLIKRNDGQTYSIRPEAVNRSPLDVKGIKSNLTAKEIVAFVRESRQR